MSDERYIVDVADDGSWLALDDGSKWSVRAADIPVVSVWYETQHVAVSQDDSNTYSLKNLDTAEEIKAKRRRK